MKKDFDFVHFESHAQFGLIDSILFIDLDNDGKKDLLLGGNNHCIETETSRKDAGY